MVRIGHPCERTIVRSDDVAPCPLRWNARQAVPASVRRGLRENRDTGLPDSKRIRFRQESPCRSTHRRRRCSPRLPRHPIDFAQLTVPAYRASLAAGGVRPGDAVAAEEDWRIPLSDRQLSARLYRPAADGPLPLTVFFHGGGFVSCGIDTHACAAALPPGRARSCCRSTTGLRPRHASRRPRTTHAVRWAAASARDLGARAGATAVAGDSAGGNLAVAALRARLGHCDRAPVAAVSGRRLRDRASVVRNARQRLFPDGGRDALVQAPLFRRRRRSRVAARGRSPRRTSQAWRRRRSSAPNSIRCATRPKRMRCASRRPAPVALVRWPGQLHGFASMLGAIDAADRVLTFGADALRRAFDLTEAR